MKKIILQPDEHGNIQASFDYFMKFNIQKNAKILDIGSNYGSLIYNLNLAGYKNVYGIDINKKNILKGRKLYPYLKSRLKPYGGIKIPFNNESFDVVLMFDVIEHIPDIDRFLKEEVNQVLKKEGIFIFQTPNKPMNIAWICLNHKSLFAPWWEDHCSLQTYWGLKKILKNSSFNEVKIEKYNIYTEHNILKVRKAAGKIGLIALKPFVIFPIIFYPNFYGTAKKEKK